MGREREPKSAKDAAIAASANAPTRQKRNKPTRESRGNLLLSWQHTPEYLRDNEFILRYYRREQRFRDSWKTLFQLHNETGNVWTHLLGEPRPPIGARAPRRHGRHPAGPRRPGALARRCSPSALTRRHPRPQAS